MSFARVLIEMDIKSTLPDYVWIEDSSGKVFKQVVLYNWRPAYCKVCCTPGHDCDELPKPLAAKLVVKKVWVPKVVQKVHPEVTQHQQVLEQGNVPAGVHTPPMMATAASSSDPAWKIVTRITKGLRKMRAQSPSNPFTVLTGIWVSRSFLVEMCSK